MKTAESSCFFEKAPESSLQKSRERHIMQNCVQISTGGRNRTAGREAAWPFHREKEMEDVQNEHLRNIAINAHIDHGKTAPQG